MTGAGGTIWERSDECVRALREPFRASEIVGWFRRHYPDVKEQSLRAHIQGATSNASPASRGPFAQRAPLITRIDHGLYRRANSAGRTTKVREPAASGIDMDRPSESPPVHGDRGAPADEWHHEGSVQAAVVTYLATTGWSVTSVADTATKERGVDIVARRGGEVIGVEVKGYPSKFYSDPARFGRPKPTQPATQARVWYAGAVLAAMRLRGKSPSMQAVIALPDFPTYHSLFADTKWSLDQCAIQVWWVSEDGAVTAP
jgi:hypothetical protein